jgi:hypothetical protein
LLVELAGNPTFNDLCDIPRYEDHFVKGHISAELAENTLFKRMTDCEMVLRFFAFRDARAIKGSVKSILDKCMESNATLADDELQPMRDDFSSRVDLAANLLGRDAFKLRDLDDDRSHLSQPYYDAVMVACDRMFHRRQELLKKKVALRERLQRELSKAGNRELIVGRANTADAIKKRLDFVEGCFESAL